MGNCTGICKTEDTIQGHKDTHVVILKEIEKNLNDDQASKKSNVSIELLNSDERSNPSQNPIGMQKESHYEDNDQYLVNRGKDQYEEPKSTNVVVLQQSEEFHQIITDCQASVKVVLPDGSIYQGECYGNKFHGMGKMSYQNGNVYEGMWVEGYFEGKGRFMTPQGKVQIQKQKNNQVYDGDWVKGKQHGLGVETQIDGTRYEGEFVFGIKSGEGVITYPNGETYIGSFYNDMLNGRGKYTWGQERYYEGQWLNNEIHGEGMTCWADGRKYIGKYDSFINVRYVHGKKEGYGEYHWSDGKRYIGQWKDGKQHGSGTLRYPDNSAKFGQWEFGVEIKKGRASPVSKSTQPLNRQSLEIVAQQDQISIDRKLSSSHQYIRLAIKSNSKLL